MRAMVVSAPRAYVFLCGLHKVCSHTIARFVHESRAPVTWSSVVRRTSKPHVYALRTYIYWNVPALLFAAWGNVYKCSSQEKFADALDLLRAERGGDCPELTFHGVVDAIEIGEPHVGSPMFVFTDAGVKELPSTKYNLDNAIGLAVDYRIPVNVFYSEESGSCGSYNSHDSLVRLVDESYGFGLRFNSFGEIQKAGALVSAALNGMTAITEGRWLGSDVGRRPRSVGSVGAWKSYIIPVDETVEDLIVAFSAERASHLVELRDSKETPAPVTERLDKGALWIVNSPARGVWRLVVPLEVGTHTFKVKSSSNFNLEFDYLFVLSGGKNREYPIEHPLIGKIPF